MKLKRLRLIGFKSFVEPADFLIEPGLTGVVGPNGCGKSNLVEALRWVMGEASHKAMRAAVFQFDLRLPALQPEQLRSLHRQLVVELPVGIFGPGIEVPVRNGNLSVVIANEDWP